MHPHEALLRREAEEAFSVEFYSSEHVLRYPGKSRLAGDYRGHAGLEDFVQRLGLVVRSLERDLREVLANDERGIQLVQIQAERMDGQRHAWRVAWLFRFSRGKIAESAAVVDDQQALDLFLDG